jgi:hypothetical protein
VRILSPTAVIWLFALGAALLAFWTAMRFPALGPQRILTALVVAGLAIACESPLVAFVGAMRRSAGVPAALLLVVLPSLTILFWTSACLVRSAVGPTSRRR